MEGVQHPDRVGQAGAQRGGIPSERVQCGDLDALSPGRVLGRDPLGENLSAAPGDDIEESAGPDIDDAGGKDRVMGGVRGQERSLIHPECGHRFGAGGVGDQWFAVVAGRGHDRGPAGPELSGH